MASLQKRSWAWRRARRGPLSAGWIDVRLEALERRYFLTASAAIPVNLTTVPNVIVADPPVVVPADQSSDSGNPDSSGTDNTGTTDSGSNDSGSDNSSTDDSGDSGTSDSGTGDSGTDDTGTDNSDTDNSGTDDSGTGDTGSGDTSDPTSDGTPPSVQVEDSSGQAVVAQDGNFSGTVATFTGTLSIDQYSTQIDWGDGSDPTAGQIVQNADGSFSVIASHDYSAGGEYYITTEVDASDGSADWGSQTFVADANPMVITDPVDLYPNTSTDAQSQYLGEFFDSNPTAAPGDYSINVDWGDGTTSAGQATPDGDGGFDIYADHAYAGVGTFNVNVTITRNDGTTLTSSGTAQTWADDPGNDTPIGGGVFWNTFNGVAAPGTILFAGAVDATAAPAPKLIDVSVKSPISSAPPPALSATPEKQPIEPLPPAPTTASFFQTPGHASTIADSFFAADRGITLLDGGNQSPLT